MCRSIKPLFNFDPPATYEEIHAASLQYVRKLTGFQKPSHINEQAFNHAVEDIAKATKELLHAMATDAKPKNREEEAARARQRAIKRFGDK